MRAKPIKIENIELIFTKCLRKCQIKKLLDSAEADHVFVFCLLVCLFLVTAVIACCSYSPVFACFF